jgi:hypothetical protein
MDINKAIEILSEPGVLHPRVQDYNERREALDTAIGAMEAWNDLRSLLGKHDRIHAAVLRTIYEERTGEKA